MAINIGVGTVSLRLPENMDLKGKRMVVRSITGRVKSRFKISAAEIADNDSWQYAVIGFCCISNDKRHSNEVISKVISFIEHGGFDAEVLDVTTEIIDL
jgi:uncharacterized protein YlxP (DUF503 family)